MLIYENMDSEHICIVQYDDRSEEELGHQAELMKQNEKLCKEKSSSCTYFNLKYNADKPIYWEKVFVTSDVMKSNPQCDIVAYLDSDAVMNTSPDMFADAMKNSDFLLTDDPSLDPKKLWTQLKPFNAGVWAVRNSETGIQIMEEWKNAYNPDMWWKNAKNRWTCGLTCEWGGPAYEQGAFVSVINDHCESMRKESWKVWNNKLCDSDIPSDALVCHFMGGHKRSIPKYIQSLKE